MASFKVPCPSCEHQVSVKSEAVGTKVECPKCKYRFKAEAPAGGAAADAGKGDKEAKKGAPAAGGKKGSKKLVAVAAGVLAAGVLAYAAYSFMFKGPDTAKKGGPKGGPYPPPVKIEDPPGNGDKKDDKDKKDEKKDPPKKPTAPASDREATNLLPPDTVALLRVDPDKVRQTPASFLFDRAALDMFRTSLGFDAAQVAAYYHAAVGPARDPFGVVRLKAPVFERDLIAGMARPPGAPRPVGRRKWNLYELKGNPFVTAAGNTLHFPSLFGELFDRPPAAPAKPPPAPRAVGLCVYDSQHVLVGDLPRLEAFLADLDDAGYPKFRSAVDPTAGQARADKPLYLSLDLDLKRVLQQVGAEADSPPPALYAEEYARGRFDPKLLKPDYLPAGTVLDPVLAKTKYLGLSLNAFGPNRLNARVWVEMESAGAAFEAVRDHLAPALTLAAPAVGYVLNTPVEFRNSTATGSAAPPPGGAPGQPGGEDVGGRPGVSQPPFGRGQPPVGVPPFGVPPGTLPGEGQPPPKETDPEGPVAPSYLELFKTDAALTLAVELNWSNDTYRLKIEPRLVGAANTLRGRMAVFASDRSFHALTEAVRRMTEATGAFPRGTAERRASDPNRMGLPHPPATRVSFFADLLPYLGRDALERGIDRDRAWYEGDALAAGEAWVPELLVSTYPEGAWRATSPFVADGRVLGGTNYVAVAGVGADAARLDPGNKDDAKRVGITGYDWGSKVDEVKDGLANTIYLLQTPPGLSQPWVAGGGATVRGLDEKDPMRGFRHTHPDGKVGTYALMGDGTVRWIPGDIKPDLLLAMATRAGGEDIAARLDAEAPRVDPPKKAEPEPPPAEVEVAPEPREKK